jgi:hypothetical protein
MSKPLTATISHELGKEGAKRRIADSLGQVRAQLAPYVTSIEDRWVGDRLEFRLAALGQVVTGTVEVYDELVKIEVLLPWMMGLLGGMIAKRVRQQGTAMLEKPKA